MKKRVLSLLLALTMCLSLSVPAWGETAYSLTNANGYSVIDISQSISLAFKHESNGDIRCYTIVDDVVVSESFYDESEFKIVSTSLNTSRGKTETQTTLDLHTQIASEYSLPTTAIASVSSTLVGSITYRYYIQGGAQLRTLAASYYAHPMSPSSVDINGHYRDIGMLTLALVSLLGLGQLSAVAFVTVFLDRLDVASDFVDVFFPSTVVEAEKYTMTWYASYVNVTGSFSGDKFIVTQEGYSGRTYYEGDYFASSAFSNRNSSLAACLHDCIGVYWGDGPYEVVSWN